MALALTAGPVARAQTATLTPSTTALNPAGGTITFTFNATFTGTAIVGLSVITPAGWAYVAGTGEPSAKPLAGSTELLEWYDINLLSSPVAFSFTLSYPAGTTGASVVSSVDLRPTGGSLVTLVPAPVSLGAVVAPAITAQPASQSVSPGSPVSFAVTATGTATLGYQWRKNGSAIANATAATLTLAGVQPANAGSYTVVVSNGAGAVISNAATLTVVAPPVISVQPVSSNVASGGSVAFNVVATGAAPLAYQWTKNGTVVVGATASSLALASVQQSDAGVYAVTVSNPGGAVTSSTAALTVGSTVVSPSIITQPTSATVAAGGTASFSVVAGGSVPLSYQWRKDGVSLVGATGATLALTNLKTGDAGNYTVVVSNSAGTATSNAAILTVTSIPPTITQQPVGAAASSGANVTFTVAASSTAPLSYQWRKDGANLAGATSATLTLTGVQPANAGSYSVVVANSAGTVTSNAATLAVMASRISNFSVRTNLGSGQTLTVGFVTSGSRQLLVRAVGPGLVPLGITSGFYPDPRIALRNQRTGLTVAQNDNWDAGLAATFVSLGAFGLGTGSTDAALLYPVDEPHTAQVSGTGSGIMLVEVYDAESTGTARLTNVSARNQVGTGANILIAGFVIDGTADLTLLIRGIGPALRDVFGVPGALADPRLEIFRQADGAKLTENDNWDASLVSTFDQVGAYRFTAGSKDAALLITLQPGAYTVQISGVGGTTGDGVVEVYEVP